MTNPPLPLSQSSSRAKVTPTTKESNTNQSKDQQYGINQHQYNTKRLGDEKQKKEAMHAE